MKKIFSLIVIFLSGSLLAFAQTQALKPVVVKPVYFDVSPPLSVLAATANGKADNSWKDGIVKNKFNFRNKPNTGNRPAGQVDPGVQSADGSVLVDTTIQNFDGVNNINGVLPPDTYGDVGPNHYFQVVNLSYAIFNKSGSLLLGPVANSTIFNGLPNNSNDGDGVVLYDEQADRWLFSQFSMPNFPSGPFFQMIAVSTTPNPTGTWYRWQYQFTNMPDYPKFGVWPDAYYMSANQFTPTALNWAGVLAASFDRTAMIAGNATAQMITFTLPASNEASTLLPADCDGPFPTAGTPNYFIYINQGPDHIGMYEFHTNFVTPASATFGNFTTLPVNAFTINLTGVAQKGTTRKLDPLNDRLMYRNQFRKFSDHWAMVTNHSVDLTSTTAGIRWYELRKTTGAWSIYQQSTFGPSDGNSRWMASVALDSSGNMAVGYSISGSNLYPSIKYCGRMKNDPLNTLTIAERGIFNGAGSQTSSSSRWGDYSGMSVDPSSTATFWYTQEYYSSTSNSSWRTRVASFSFANVFSVTASATPSVINVGQQSQLNVVVSGGTTPYTYSWTSIPAGFTSNIQNPVVTPTVTTKYVAHVTSGTTTRTDTTQVQVNVAVTATANPYTINSGASSQLNATAIGGTGVYTYSWTSSPPGFTSNIQNPVVTPVQTTIYTATINSGTQVGSDTTKVTVNMSPLTVNVTATPQDICAGQTTQLNAAAAGGSLTYTYFWYSNPPGFTSNIQNPVAQPLQTTLYIASVNDGFQTVVDSVLVTVTMPPSAYAGIDTTVCLWVNQVPLHGTASGYQGVNWTTSGDGTFANAAALNTIYFPGAGDKSNGSVNLTLHAFPVLPCVNAATSVKHLLFDPCLGINDPNDNGFAVRIEPNPSLGDFILYVNGVKNEKVRIDILDMQGKTVYNTEINTGAQTIKKQITLSGASGGIYFVKVTTDTRSHVDKLIIK